MTGPRRFTSASGNPHLIVRSFNTPPSKGKPYREIGAGGVLAAGRKILVALVSGPHGTHIHIDGQPVKNYPDVRLLSENETLEGHRVPLGNSPDLSCPWAGTLMGFALFGRAWTSAEVTEPTRRQGRGGRCRAAAAGLRQWPTIGSTVLQASRSSICPAPRTIWRKPARLVFDKRPLGLPNGQSFSGSDVTLNLLGFVPFGFLVCLRLLSMGRFSPRGCLFLAIAVGFAVSLAIELTQVWLPGRDSSLLDLTTNTMGSAIGGAMAYHLGWVYGTWLKR